MNRAADQASAQQGSRSGFAFGFGAYLLWGVLPVYFKAIDTVPALDIVAHRILWSLPLLFLLIALGRSWAAFRGALTQPRTLALLTLTAVLIGANWLLYVYAVTSGHILAASFGYYLNPLANVVLGYLVLKEHLSRLQWAAVAIAAAGITALAGGALGQLWISLTLCVSFALYGLLRKVAPVDSVVGLTVETGLLFPIAAGWLLWRWATGADWFGESTSQAALLMLAGVVSTTPLLLFTAAARRLPYSTLGMLQFVAPTLQFLLAVIAYGEQFTLAHGIAFGAIWLAVVLFVAALIRKAQVTVPPPE